MIRDHEHVILSEADGWTGKEYKLRDKEFRAHRCRRKTKIMIVNARE